MGYFAREAKRFVSRIVNTYEGIKVTFQEEASFPQWIVVNIASITLTFFVEMSVAEKILIIALGLAILIAELFNTAIEAAIDRVGPEIHPLSKKAKDAACAAVALTAITGLIAWLLVFFG